MQAGRTSSGRRAATGALLLALAACGSARSMSGKGSGGSGGSVPSAGGGGDGGASGGAGGDRDAASSGGAGGGAGSTGGVGGAAGDSIVGGLLALTRACKTPVSHAYAFDSDPADPDAGKSTTICELPGAVFWVADMDIDCDGVATSGKCDQADDCCYFPDTAVHGASGPLTAAVTPYIVIPQDFMHAGLADGAVAAVIYQGRLTYAIFGDTGPTDIIGEASYACAERLGINPDARTGGVQGATVTYIVFTKGMASVPQNVEDQAETQALGESLAKELLGKTAP